MIMAEPIHDIDSALHEIYLQRYPAEAVRHLEQEDAEKAANILANQPPAKNVKIWERFSPEFGARVLAELEIPYIRSLFESINPNRGASLLKALEPEKVESLLSQVPPRAQNDLRRAIEYPEDSAGALMDTKVMYFRPNMTVAETINILRSRKQHAYRKLYTVDDENRLRGELDVEEIAIADHDKLLSELERTASTVVEVMSSREEVVAIFDKYKITDLPVVDFDRRLVGVLRYHVLVDAALEESSADMQTMVGVSRDERALSPTLFSTRKRLPWLQINLATAFLAAAVVGLFEDTIAKYTALAVLLPVVAGQSGNTGAQALAVTMRGLALKEIYPRMWARIVFKEFNVGLLNGLAVALTTGIGVYIWSRSTGLAVIIVLSMVLSMIIASVAGAAIPILLTITGQDPAQSSSIFLTTVTDIAGFFSFLGIATLLISQL